MAGRNTNPAYAQRVRIVESLYDYAVHAVTVTAVSQTLADLIGAALQDDCGEVEVVNQGGATIYYQCDDTAATVADMPIPTNSTYTIPITAETLTSAQLIAAGNVAVHLVQRTSAGD